MNILMVGDVVLSTDCLREPFCCDITSCKGACCIEGDAGAPITPQEVTAIEDILSTIWEYLSPEAQKKIQEQGISYTDKEGDLVTSIVNGKDCVFTCYDKHGNCQCAIQLAKNKGEITIDKPISCSLYPIREKIFKGGLVALNYHRWDICANAQCLGKKLRMPVYAFLREPLITRFGKEWYDELCQVAESLKEKDIIN